MPLLTELDGVLLAESTNITRLRRYNICQKQFPERRASSGGATCL